jgi:DeoR/GlpR family transcriptional regulator of sugar metabolism
MDTVIPLARRDLILSRLGRGQAVVAKDLADEFGLSEDAIRRDLRALAAEGLCRRVYGGALPVSPATAPMAQRIDEARERKDALALAAATTIGRGEFLFLDSGSTNLALARRLPEEFDLTVATNSIDIAGVLLARPDLRLVLVGGQVDPLVGGCVDADAVQSVSRMNIDRCFVGACAVSPDGAVSAFHAADASFKRALVAASRENVALVTTGKLGERAPYRVARLGQIGCLVVEHDAGAADLRKLAKAGAKLLRAAEPA